MDNQKNSILGGVVAGAISALLVSLIVVNIAEPGRITENDGTVVEGGLKVVQQEDQVVEVVKDAIPAVVSIIITKDVPVIERYYQNTPNPFGDLFGDPFSFQIPQYRENGTEKKEVGGGSGFIVSGDGYVMTNKHVVNDEEAEYTVFLNDGSQYEGKVIDRDPLNDIAVLKIETDKDLPFLEFGDSENLNVGQTAIAIGNPLLEFNNSVSVGVVSGLSRSITASDGMQRQSEQLEGVIQTDAAINPGNSGGPLLDLTGKVIGVNVAVASAENIGFSLPANMAKSAFESVKINGEIKRPFLGVRYMIINEAVKEANKLNVDYGVIVIRGEGPEELAVVPGSPADKAGLQENDIILEVDGEKLDEGKSLARMMAAKNIGDEVELKILRKGEEQVVKVKLDELPE